MKRLFSVSIFAPLTVAALATSAAPAVRAQDARPATAANNSRYVQPGQYPQPAPGGQGANNAPATTSQTTGTAQKVQFDPQTLPSDRVNRQTGRPNRNRGNDNRINDWKGRQSALEQQVRHLMSSHGFTDAEVQNTIILHIQSEARARSPLREMGRRLFRGLNAPQVGDAEMSLALGGYVTALAADRARRAKAEAVLDARIGWSTNPRLHSMLLLFGIIGESPITLPVRNFSLPPRPIRRPRENEQGAPRDPAQENATNATVANAGAANGNATNATAAPATAATANAPLPENEEMEENVVIEAG